MSKNNKNKHNENRVENVDNETTVDNEINDCLDEKTESVINEEDNNINNESEELLEVEDEMNVEKCANNVYNNENKISITKADAFIKLKITDSIYKKFEARMKKMNIPIRKHDDEYLVGPLCENEVEDCRKKLHNIGLRTFSI